MTPILVLLAALAASSGFDRALALLQERWVYADRIDWSEKGPALRTGWERARTPADRAGALLPLFEQVNDVHSSIRTADRSFAHFEAIDEGTRTRLLPLLERERAIVGKPEAVLMEGDIGYLLVPGIAVTGREQVAHAATLLRAAIESVAPRVKRGWIVDLRLNGGGNLMPMLLGLRPLLGDGVVGGTRDRAGALVQEWVLRGDELLWRDGSGERVLASLPVAAADTKRAGEVPIPPSHPAAAQPLVVILGPLTRSSGAGLALAFHGRTGATSVGEPTASGYTTVTAPFELEDGLACSLAVGFMTDRSGVAFRDRVEPRHRVDGLDRFDALAEDAKVRKALDLLGAAVRPSSSGAYDPLARDSDPIEHLDLVVEDDARQRELPLRVYLPKSRSAAPVVLFSHGLGGASTNNPYLGEHWAARGFVAVFMQHPGSDESVWRDVPAAQRMAAMGRAANAANFLRRVQDVPSVLDQLARWNEQEEHALAGRLDLERIGMSGHSFGAVTTQAVSGQAPVAGRGFTDRRIDAAVLMSPSAPRRGGPDSASRAFAGVHIPWLLLTGTRDEALIGDQSVETRLAVYPALPPGDKFEIVLWNAEHSAFGDRPLPGDREVRDPNHHRVILAVTTAFWDAFLRNDERAKAWLTAEMDDGGVHTVLGPRDRWQHK